MSRARKETEQVKKKPRPKQPCDAARGGLIGRAICGIRGGNREKKY